MGDIKASLQALAPHLRAQLGQTPRDLTRATASRAARDQALATHADAATDTNPIAPIIAAREAVRAIGPSTAIVDEAIATMQFGRGILSSHTPGRYAALRGGALGWAMPAAIGTSLGLDREPVVCLVGDGAALYSPQALWTAAHEQLPVTFVVMNNREYNVLKNFMRGQSHYLSARSNRFIAMQIDTPPIDYVALARGFGVPAKRVDRASDIAPAIEAGIASGDANLIEITIGT